MEAKHHLMKHYSAIFISLIWCIIDSTFGWVILGLQLAPVYCIIINIESVLVRFIKIFWIIYIIYYKLICLKLSLFLLVCFVLRERISTNIYYLQYWYLDFKDIFNGTDYVMNLDKIPILGQYFRIGIGPTNLNHFYKSWLINKFTKI